MALPNTHFGYEGISAILGDGKKTIFFSGIGGISMNSLSQVCRHRGHTVLGYDRTPSEITEGLKKLDINVYYTSDPSLLEGVDMLVYTVAIPSDDPIYVAAGERGIPRVSRADFLGYVMMNYASRIGISGMHGKSTTTAIVSSIYDAAGLNPTVFGGAVMKEVGSSNIIGDKSAFIFEACEYMDSFLDFYPSSAVVLNVEMDHVDYFHSMEQIRRSFTAFMNKAHTAVVNMDSADAMAAAKESSARVVTFGDKDSGADYYADCVEYSHGLPSFEIYHKGELICRVKMNVPGHHIVADALAAAAVSHSDGVPADAISRGLESYKGICRRMELRGKTVGGADVYDDYAHHPTELKATLSTAAELGYKKTLCVFQSHTYSRTAELFDDFVSALAESEADEIVLAEIYPARESNTYGVYASQMAEKINALGKKATALPTFEDIAEYVEKCLGEGDAVFVIGAGDVIKVSNILLK